MEEQIGQADFALQDFQEDLLGWFERKQRILPWRENRDPYRVWVSEIMLQQTRVDTVIPYYNRFMEKFPTLEDLAEAELEDVYRLWEGLGYYSRARNLHTAVREVKEQYGGTVPNTPAEIHKLKGVGPYTAGAILSIAYGLPEPAVDGNVMRVLSRIFLIKEEITKAKSRKIFEELVRKIIAKGNPSFFNQSLMELGALICTPKSPQCTACPVENYCLANTEGIQEQLPIKKRGKQPRNVQMAVGLLQDDRGNWLICRRPAEGLLANLWEFPGIEVPVGKKEKEVLSQFLYQEFGIKSVPYESVLQYNHVFSHLVWDLHLYPCGIVRKVGEKEGSKREYHWVSLEEMATYPFSASHRKIVDYLNENQLLLT